VGSNAKYQNAFCCDSARKKSLVLHAQDDNLVKLSYLKERCHKHVITGLRSSMFVGSVRYDESKKWLLGEANLFSRVILLINIEACCKSDESQPGHSTVT
jgi:hypothetical protein